MPIGSSRRRPGCAIWKAWAEAGMWSCLVVMCHPLAKDSAQVPLVDVKPLKDKAASFHSEF